MTNEKVEKIEELNTNDFDYTSSIYAFLQKKYQFLIVFTKNFFNIK